MSFKIPWLGWTIIICKKLTDNNVIEFGGEYFGAPLQATVDGSVYLTGIKKK